MQNRIWRKRLTFSTIILYGHVDGWRKQTKTMSSLKQNEHQLNGLNDNRDGFELLQSWSKVKPSKQNPIWYTTSIIINVSENHLVSSQSNYYQMISLITFLKFFITAFLLFFFFSFKETETIHWYDEMKHTWSSY